MSKIHTYKISVMVATLGIVLTVGVLTTIYLQQAFAVTGTNGGVGGMGGVALVQVVSLVQMAKLLTVGQAEQALTVEPAV